MHCDPHLLVIASRGAVVCRSLRKWWQAPDGTGRAGAHLLPYCEESPAVDCRTYAIMEKATPMTIIIEIELEVQAELSRQAAAHGVDIGSYAAELT